MKKIISNKSIKRNAIISTLQTAMSILFPIITYPYVVRILGVYELGKFYFSSSYVNYFVLLAGLGIGTYAIREGTPLRDDKQKFQTFTNEIFTINIASMFISILLLVITVFCIPKLRNYRILMLILGAQIFFTTVGRNWLYSLYEDYLPMAIRTIIFQFISMGLLFTLVKSERDVLVYCLIIVVSSVGKELINIFDSRKYAKIGFTTKGIKKHILPIVLIFSMSISATICSNIDMTMLGFWGTDWNVGIYSVSVKVYSLINQMLAAMFIVTIPRFSYYVGKKERTNYISLFDKILNSTLYISVPAAVGLIMLSKEIILVIGGSQYLPACSSLKVLSISLVFNLIAYVIGYGVLLPNKKEKYLFISILVSTLVNVVLNIFLIPRYYQAAAAVTTLIAEITSFACCAFFMKKSIDYRIVQVKNILKNSVSIIIGVVAIIIICYVGRIQISNDWIRLIVSGVCSVACYLGIGILFKNPFVYEVLKFAKIKRQN